MTTAFFTTETGISVRAPLTAAALILAVLGDTQVHLRLGESDVQTGADIALLIVERAAAQAT